MKPPEPLGAELPIPDLLRQLSTQTATLVRQEMELARAEFAQKGKAAGESAGLFAGSSLFGIGAFGALTLCFIGALAYVLPLWGAALIVAVAYGVIAGVMAMFGKKSLQKITSPIPEQTVQSLRSDVSAVRQGIERKN